MNIIEDSGFQEDHLLQEQPINEVDISYEEEPIEIKVIEETTEDGQNQNKIGRNRKFSPN